MEKPIRNKKIDRQDSQIPATIQDLINRYDLDNDDIYKYLEEIINNINLQENNIESINETVNTMNENIETIDNKIIEWSVVEEW